MWVTQITLFMFLIESRVLFRNSPKNRTEWGWNWFKLVVWPGFGNDQFFSYLSSLIIILKSIFFSAITLIFVYSSKNILSAKLLNINIKF